MFAEILLRAEKLRLQRSKITVHANKAPVWTMNEWHIKEIRVCYMNLNFASSSYI